MRTDSSTRRGDSHVRAADTLADVMLSHGVDRVFCVPGESYLPLLDALHDRASVQLVVARHESGAGFMAVADAKCTQRPGVCLVSRGPGAMNAAVAVHTAEQDAVPLILIIGQVSANERGLHAFQEMDYAKTFSDMTKAVWEVSSGDQLVDTFCRAWQTAVSGTPGPVVISVTENAFSDSLDASSRAVASRPRTLVACEPHPALVERVAQLIGQAHRPILIAGGAVGSTAGRAALSAAAEQHQLPVALTYRRQDIFDNRSQFYAGYLGSGLPKSQLDVLREADLVLAIGTRLTDVTTQDYKFPTAPQPEQTLVHVYPDPLQCGRIFRADHAIACDPVRFLELLASQEVGAPRSERSAWVQRLSALAASLSEYRPTSRVDGLEFGAVVSSVAQLAAFDAVLTLDAGNFAGWVHHVWRFHPTQLLLGVAGGSMGFGVPATVAAALRFPERQVIGFAGDGGFMMTGAELATAAQYGARFVFFVSTNGSYGTIREHQERTYPGRTHGTDLHRVDAAQFARACGVTGLTIRSESEVDSVVAQALGAASPVVVDVQTSLQAISPNTTLSQMRARRS